MCMYQKTPRIENGQQKKKLYQNMIIFIHRKDLDVEKVLQTHRMVVSHKRR